VLAVGDGVIDYVMDGIPENVPQSDGRTIMPVPLTNETVSGNWVSLRLRKGVYAFFAHLQPGSVRVRVGQRVRRGQVIGLVGNSGNSAAPHLHFHLGNANSLNGSDAVPHVYRSFIGCGDNAPDSVPEQRTNQLPGPSAIIRFP
jgi:murein DD-endopeptidase MepM/ murein hydrolase activator NlpD